MRPNPPAPAPVPPDPEAIARPAADARRAPAPAPLARGDAPAARPARAGRVTAVSSTGAFDDADAQGLVRFGYGSLTEAVFLLVAIDDAAAARRWLATAPVADAVERDAAPSTALQVALGRGALERLGLAPEVMDALAPELLSGLAGEESRSRRLGDVGDSAPARWSWGAPGAVPDAAVLLFAQPGRLAAWAASVEADLRASGLRVLARLDTSNLDGVEPFGFTDGISQPEPDWRRTLPADGRERLAYGNLMALGELLLGYPNEYGKYTRRPVLPRSAAAEGALPLAEDAPDRLDLGRNGTYLVLRTLRQDVRGFWQFLDRSAGGRPEERRRLAACMVGRAMDGTPLVDPARAAIAGVGPDPDDVRYNQFTYDGDPGAARCPFGAHVRRANPRNPDLPGGGGLVGRLLRTLGFLRRDLRDDLVASTRFHRLVRRGREYGPGLSPEEALRPAPEGDPERGLHFACLNANIGRQFEFVQNAWLASSTFDGLCGEADPLLGSREPLPGGRATDAFSLVPQGGPRPRLTGLPRFVSVRGGAYFFLPGLRALRWIAGAGARP